MYTHKNTKYKKEYTHTQTHKRAHLGPESRFELLLGGPESLDVVKTVQVGEHAHYLGKPVNLKHVQKLERLHLETEAACANDNNRQ